MSVQPPQPPQPNFNDILQAVDALRVRDVRNIFAIMRRKAQHINANSLLPVYGFTIGEFSTAYVLNQNHYKRKKN